MAQLEQMRARERKAADPTRRAPAGFLTPEETEALAKAKEKAESIHCINNLKQLGLAVRTWAIDNGDMSPPNILDMTNEMATPKILVCPGDHGREAAKDFASYTPANCSYEYLAPSAPDTEPFRVLFRCPIHGHVCLCDGSVQGYVGQATPRSNLCGATASFTSTLPRKVSRRIPIGSRILFSASPCRRLALCRPPRASRSVQPPLWTP